MTPSGEGPNPGDADDDGALDEALALQLALRLSLEEQVPLRHRRVLAEPQVQAEPASEPAPESKELWAYAVWAGPGTKDIVGVHVGGRAAWRAIVQSIGRYLPGQHKLRRAPTEREATSLFNREAEKHGVEFPLLVFRH